MAARRLPSRPPDSACVSLQVAPGGGVDLHGAAHGPAHRRTDQGHPALWSGPDNRRWRPSRPALARLKWPNPSSVSTLNIAPSRRVVAPVETAGWQFGQRRAHLARSPPDAILLALAVQRGAWRASSGASRAAAGHDAETPGRDIDPGQRGICRAHWRNWPEKLCRRARAAIRSGCRGDKAHHVPGDHGFRAAPRPRRGSSICSAMATREPLRISVRR